MFIGAIIVVGLVWFVPETSTPSARRGIDLAGNALVTVGFAGLVFALIEGGTYGWWTQSVRFAIGGFHWPVGWPSPISFICAIGALILLTLVLREARRRRGRVVLVDLSLFAVRSFSAGLGAIFMVSLGELGILFVLPLFLEGVLGVQRPAHRGGAPRHRARHLGGRGVTPELARTSALVAWLASASSSKSSASSGSVSSSRGPWTRGCWSRGWRPMASASAWRARSFPA